MLKIFFNFVIYKVIIFDLVLNIEVGFFLLQFCLLQILNILMYFEFIGFNYYILIIVVRICLKNYEYCYYFVYVIKFDVLFRFGRIGRNNEKNYYSN